MRVLFSPNTHLHVRDSFNRTAFLPGPGAFSSANINPLDCPQASYTRAFIGPCTDTPSLLSLGSLLPLQPSIASPRFLLIHPPPTATSCLPYCAVFLSFSLYITLPRHSSHHNSPNSLGIAVFRGSWRIYQYEWEM
jgi:hypothetical protein